MAYDRRIAPVAELVDAPDSKSGGGNTVLVRSRPGAPAIAAPRLRLASQALRQKTIPFIGDICRESPSPPGLAGHRAVSRAGLMRVVRRVSRHGRDEPIWP